MPDIAVAYNEHWSPNPFQKFADAVLVENLRLVVRPIPNSNTDACIEWFMAPLAGAVFIAKSYFDGFLKEAGKDHYQGLKKSLAHLTNEVMSKQQIVPELISTPGKVSSNNPYSLAFSVYAETNDGSRFKLLLPKPSEIEDYTEIVHKFLEFINDFYSRIKVLEDIGFDEATPPPSHHIFVHMNKETKQIEWLDVREFL
jgi:hypothetical protein